MRCACSTIILIISILNTFRNVDSSDLLDRLGSIQSELTSIRRDIHAHPESAMEEVRTASIVVSKLRQWGVNVTERIGKLGIVGMLQGTVPSDRSIGLRADMDALELIEATNVSYTSTIRGVMHACGHDGHTTMLLGAAKYLSENRDSFSGTVYFIFQPAEEKGVGAQALINDGLFERFPMDSVYGLHNIAGFPVGQFAIRSGPMMAAIDIWTVTFRGTGGHGAAPHLATDVSVLAAQFILALQTIVSRNIAPTAPAVVSIGAIESGIFTSLNVLPSEIRIGGTVRSFTEDVRNTIEQRMKELASNLAVGFGCVADIVYSRDGIPLVNDAQCTERAVKTAKTLVGAKNVFENIDPLTGSDDFAEMLKKKPGAYIFMGNGNISGFQHSPTYDFNDDAAIFGVAYWISLVQQELAK